MNTAELWLDEVLNILYPRRCPFCDRLLPKGRYLCEACEEKETKLFHVPPALEKKNHSFFAVERAFSAFYYEDLVQETIVNMKFGGKPWYSRELGDITAMRVFGCEPQREHGVWRLRSTIPLKMEYDCIVPVPASRGRAGKGLPARIAGRIGLATDLPVMENVLVKIRKTPRQATLSREERLTNLIGAFDTRNREKLENKRVLLVDDVITTGSTVSNCSAALLKGGALSVSAVSIATPEHRGAENGKEV